MPKNIKSSTNAWGENVKGAIAQGEIHGENCPRELSWGNFIGTNFLGGSCPAKNYLGVIFQVWSKNPWVVALGDFFRKTVVQGRECPDTRLNDFIQKIGTYFCGVFQLYTCDNFFSLKNN